VRDGERYTAADSNGAGTSASASADSGTASVIGQAAGDAR
jgi:hypothetical protein